MRCWRFQRAIRFLILGAAAFIAGCGGAASGAGETGRARTVVDDGLVLEADLTVAEGRRGQTVDISFDLVPVTDVDRTREMEGQQGPAEAILQHIPETKPAFVRLLVDDTGRYWFKRPTANPDSADWWIADPKAEYVAIVSLPRHVDLMVVQNGDAYGRAQDASGAPALVRDRIVEPV